MSRHVLCVRLDNAGDVLLTGPAVRAVAAAADRVTMLVAPQGEAAARLLPGVDDVEVWALPVDRRRPAVGRRAGVDDAGRPAAAGRRSTRRWCSPRSTRAPLPTALLLRQAGVGTGCGDQRRLPRVAARRAAPGRRRPARARARAVARRGGRVLAFRTMTTAGSPWCARCPRWRRWSVTQPYVVLHPGASVPARAWGREPLPRSSSGAARRRVASRRHRWPRGA